MATDRDVTLPINMGGKVNSSSFQATSLGRGLIAFLVSWSTGQKEARIRVLFSPFLEFHPRWTRRDPTRVHLNTLSGDPWEPPVCNTAAAQHYLQKEERDFFTETRITSTPRCHPFCVDHPAFLRCPAEKPSAVSLEESGRHRQYRRTRCWTFLTDSHTHRFAQESDKSKRLSGQRRRFSVLCELNAPVCCF